MGRTILCAVIFSLIAMACLLAPSVVAAGVVSVRIAAPPGAAPVGPAKSPAAAPQPVAKPAADKPKAYAPMAEPAPQIDGKLDDACWAKAPAIKLAKTLDAAADAAVATEVRFVRDAKNLYVAVRAAEPNMDKLKAEKREHDGGVWEDDSIELFLGIADDNYFHFGVNAAGSTYDGKVKDPGFNSGFKAAAGRAANEWTAELAVPLDKLLGQAKPPATWTLNVTRSRQAAGGQEFAWSPTGSGNSHVPESFGLLVFGDAPAASAQPVPEKSQPKQAAAAPAANPTPDGKPQPVRAIAVKETAGAGVARFDLSVVPKGAEVLKAELLVFRSKPVTGKDEEAGVDIAIFPLTREVTEGGEPAVEGEPLKMLAPWYDRFDAAEAVKAWLGGKANGGFLFKTAPAIEPGEACLDIVYEGEPKNVPPQVSEVKAFHRAGQTFITWKEIEDLAGADEIRWGQMRGILADMDKTRRVRYSVYRSNKPITADTLAQATRIAQVAPLSGWNLNVRNVDRPIDEKLANDYFLNWHQWNPFAAAHVDDAKYGLQCVLDRLVIEDGKAPLPRQTGLYVHTVGEKGEGGTWHYAVLTSVDGVENTKDVGTGNTTGALEEKPGDGEPVLQKAFPPQPYFNYREQRLHYVTWVAPPQGNLPYQYYNYAVALPEPLLEQQRAATQPANPPSTQPAAKFPLELSLHRDGRSFQRTQFRLEQDSIIISPHDFPTPTWWYGYHESLGTLRSFKQGTVQPYTERRLLAFMKWAAAKWPADTGRVCVVGCNGAAGAGALHLGVRHGETFSLVLAGYGMADYAGEIEAVKEIIAQKEAAKQKPPANTLSPSLESIWGKQQWACKTDSGRSVWDELNLTRYVDELPKTTCLPLVTVTGHGILKPMREFYIAMLDKQQPFMARYGVYGGGLLLPVARTGNWSGQQRMDISKDGPWVCLRGPEVSSLNEEAKEPSGNLVVSDGIKRWWGEFHTGYVWRVEKDEPVGFEMYLSNSTRLAKPSVLVNLRRLKLRLKPDWEYTIIVQDAKGQQLRQEQLKPENGGFSFVAPVQQPGVRIIVKP